MKTTRVRRSNLILRSDPTRVLLRPFLSPTDLRTTRICALVLALPESRVRTLWAQVLEEFGRRHPEIEEFLMRRFELLRCQMPEGRRITNERKLLLGSYFSHEYSLEAAALFNPSMVPHPDQRNLPKGSLRFILSLRATGEGHISSVTFRTGTLDAANNIKVTAPRHFCIEPEQTPNAAYNKALFAQKIDELRLEGTFTRRALFDLPEEFTLEQLRESVLRAGRQLRARKQQSTDIAAKVMLLAQSNYEVHFAADSHLSERVLFPSSPSQSNGIEDARFVKFREDDGSEMYCATYTAYDGRMILPQFIETPDFLNFRFITLNGQAVRNKGLALFPRKIGGCYVMLGRQDYENIHVMFSDQLHFWNSAEIVLRPEFPWEFIQLGNCGSPIETKAGWLVISHGVGPMRKYCIGAFLLDLNDPTRVIGRLREPLIEPNENEREGYVPNVVYSCGSLVHGDHLIVPYAMSDSATTFATLPLDEVLAAMV